MATNVGVNDHPELEPETDQSDCNKKEGVKRKRMKERSEVWEHFVKEDLPSGRQATCKYCGMSYKCGAKKNGTSVLWAHINRCQFSSVTAVDRCFCGTSSVTTDVYFPSLESLTFKKLVKLQNWTGLEVNDMPRLRILKIENCPEFINLPSLKNLTSLVELKIERCPTMISLPELPPSLESLKIRESNLLKDRCAIECEDWKKVDCIPYVEIDDTRIPTSGANNVPTLPTRPHQNIVYQGYQLVKDNIGAFSRLILRD